MLPCHSTLTANAKPVVIGYPFGYPGGLGMASTNAQRKPATGGARYCELCNSDDEVADYPNGYGGVVALCRGCRLAEDAAS